MGTFLAAILGSAPKTTILGFALGALTYLNQIGTNWPTTKAEWGALAVAVLLAGLGRLTADAPAIRPPVADKVTK